MLARPVSFTDSLFCYHHDLVLAANLALNSVEKFRLCVPDNTRSVHGICCHLTKTPFQRHDGQSEEPFRNVASFPVLLPSASLQGGRGLRCDMGLTPLDERHNTLYYLTFS